MAKAVSILANENKGDNNFVYSFMKYANVTKEKALEILTYGSGPVIVAKNKNFFPPLSSGNVCAGKYLGDAIPFTEKFIYINDDVLDNNTNGDDQLAFLEGVVTLWHEGIHYGDHLDHFGSTAGEVGFLAETELFGFYVSRKLLGEYKANGKWDDEKGFYDRSKEPDKPLAKDGYYLGDKDAIRLFYQKITKIESMDVYKNTPSYSINIDVIKDLFKKAEICYI